MSTATGEQGTLPPSPSSAETGAAGSDPPDAPDAPTRTDLLTERLRGRAVHLSRWLGPSVALYALVKLLGFVAFLLLNRYAQTHPVAGDTGQYTRFLDVLGTWDGRWYMQIAGHGYDPKLVLIGNPDKSVGFNYAQNSAAFFPLYPALIALVHLTGASLLWSGIVVAVLGSLAAAAGIFAVAERVIGRDAAIIAAALWAVVPSSGVEWAVYSDSLFVALSAWCLYFIVRRSWLTAGLIAFAAGFSRPTSAVLAATLFTAAVVAVVRKQDKVWRPLAACVMAPLGIVGFIGWVGIRAHNIHAYSILESDAWNHYFDFGSWTAHSLVHSLLGRSNWGSFPQEDLIATLFLLLMPCLLIAYARLKPPLYMVVYILLTIVFAAGSEQFYGNISRYLLPAFPLLFPIASALRRIGWPSVIACLCVLGVVSGWYAGFVPFVQGIP